MAIPVSTASATGTTSVIVSKPGSNWVSGSLLIAVVSITGTSTLPSPPTGWTIVKQHSTAAAQANLSVYSLALTSAGAASYTFDATGATSATAGVLEYSASTASGVDTTAAPSTNSAATATAVSFTAITTTNASEVVCLALSLASGGQTASGWTSPYAEELHQAGTGGLATFYFADATQAAAGTTGTIGVTLSGSAAHWTAIEFALLPGSSGVSLTLAGLAATGALGAVTPADTLAVSALTASTAIGAPAEADAVALAGLSSTTAFGAEGAAEAAALAALTAATSLGTPAVTEKIALSALAASTGLGVLAVTAGNIAVLTGIAATAALGTPAEAETAAVPPLTAAAALGPLTPAELHALSGRAATTGLGSPTAADAVALAGQSVATGLGAPAALEAIAAAALTAAAVLGIVTPAEPQALPSQSATTSLGTPLVAETAALGGQSVSTGFGAPAVAETVVPAGLAATGGLGAVGPAEPQALSGRTASTGLGVPAVAEAVAPPALTAATALGTPALAEAVPLSGLAATTGLGAVTGSAGATVAALSGIAAAAALGPPAVAEAVAVAPGLTAATGHGAVALADTIGVAGIAASAAAGVPAVADTVAALGLAAVTGLGNLVPLSSGDPAWTTFVPNDLTVRSAPTFPGKPAYLGSVRDPNYGTTIVRITGDPGTAIPGIAGGIWGYCARHHYSLDQAWNADESLIALVPNQDPNTPIAVATSATTTSGNTLTFATNAVLNTTVAPGYSVADTTTPASIPAGRTVTAIGTNTVTISGAAVTVASGDTISFTDAGSPRDWLFLDGQTYAPKYAPTPPPGNQDARWHPTDPTKMIYVDGTTIGYYFPASGGSTTVVHTFAGYTGLTLGSFKGFPTPGANPIVPIMGTRTSDSATVVFSYDLSSSTKSVDIVPATISSATVSYSGTYIGIINATDQTYVYNRVTGALVQGPWGNGSLQEGQPSHADITIDQAGNDVYVGSDRTNGGIVIKRRLSDGTITGLTSATSPNFSDHTSARSVAFPGWAVATYDGFTEGAGAFPLYLGEIIAAKLDASRNPYRLGHHFSEDPSPNDFYAQVQASISPLGTRIIFASNWNNPDGQSKRPIQAYVIDLRTATAALTGLSAATAHGSLSVAGTVRLPSLAATTGVAGVTASGGATPVLAGLAATAGFAAPKTADTIAEPSLAAHASLGTITVTLGAVTTTALPGLAAHTAIGSLSVGIIGPFVAGDFIASVALPADQWSIAIAAGGWRASIPADQWSGALAADRWSASVQADHWSVSVPPG